MSKEAVITTNSKEEKMSEVLLEFAKPLTDECKNDEAFYNALQISAVAWNSSFIPSGERNKLIDESINKYINDNSEKAIAKEMYPLQISYKDGQQHFAVISSTVNHPSLSGGACP